MAVGIIISQHFPALDKQLYDYIFNVLENGKEEFEDSEEVFECVGEMLVEVSDGLKTEADVREICDELLLALKGSIDMNAKVQRRALLKPVLLGEMANRLETNVDDFNSIWMPSREVPTQVNQRKLKKAEDKIKQKQEKRDGEGFSTAPVACMQVAKEATANQMINRRDVKIDETGRSRDIKIENFDIAFGEKGLLRGANLTLTFGKRYGLVGRNGIGKSTLLKMIANRSLFIPKHIRVLLVEQEVVGNDTIALEAVLECDLIRKGLLEEEKELSKAEDAGGRLEEVYQELAAIESDKAPARASEILCGLGFTPEMQRKATKEFSGGWRMRIALARALFSKPDLLLLDEPTNMLDMKAIVWLENYLINTWTSTLLCVSHDRRFLDLVPTDTLHFHNYEITSYRGNFDSFLKTKNEKLKNQEREYEAQMDYRKHVQEFIDKFRYNAKRASLVQSKIKMVEKLPELKPVEKEPKVTIKFPDPDPLSGAPILQLDGVSFKYMPVEGDTNGTTEPAEPVEGPNKIPSSEMILEKLCLNANFQSRICIVGDNGSGKTTLLKLLTGDITPVSGLRSVHRNLKVGYFTQHHVDQLTMNQSALGFLATKFPGKPSEHYRAYLGKFGISGDLSLQPVSSLSGGQKSRVAFAAMALLNPNMLVLDEPTNHLDVETVEALAESLNAYKGGVILVSHDEQLIKLVCKELWHVKDKGVTSLEGFDQYRKIIEVELAESIKQ